MMTFLEVLRMSFGALAANRARSALTVLSITIGAFAIVVMSSLADSGFKTLERGIEELGGARILIVAQKRPERGEAKQIAYARGLTLTDRERTFTGLPHIESLTLFSRLGRKEVMADSGLRHTTSVLAADAGFFDVFRMNVGRGRAFTDEENRGRAALCVVGHKLAEKVGPTPTQPLGGFLSVGPLRCRVIGVLADNDRFGTNFGFDWTDLVITPGEAMGDLDPSVVSRAAVFMKTDDPSSNDIVKRLINARLSARHPGVDDFTLFDFSGVMTRFRAIFAGMELIVALLAGIALLVGGVGVMNMMLVAVSERVKEIGVRKALGARPRAIGVQFLTEAVVLSMLGGATGVVTGLGVAVGASLLIARALAPWQLSLAPWAAISALAVTMAIGVGFGWIPAKKAAGLDPVEAMRR
jgi:putative ABC transport system permease protein